MPHILENTELTNSVKNLSLRRVLFEDFKSIGKELPIKGGWGYSLEDAIIIDKNDPIVDQDLPFHGIGIETLIVEKRIYEELIIFRREGDKFSGINWKTEKQELKNIDERYFDILTVQVSCFRDEDFELLRQDVKLNSGQPNFEANHTKKRENLQFSYSTKYYFDITSFY